MSRWRVKGRMGVLLSLLVCSGLANAALFEPQQLSSTWREGAAGAWQNSPPTASYDAFLTAAIAWCKLTDDYIVPGYDCELDPNNLQNNVVTEYSAGGGNSFFSAIVYLNRRNGFKGSVRSEWWPSDTSDTDCAPGVVDRANGYDCIDPNKLFAAEPSIDLGECTMVGNPCDAASGNKSQTEIDYRVLAEGVPSMVRYYNSKGSYRTGLGMPPGWRHAYSRTLDEEPDRKPSIFYAAPANQSSFYHSASDACTQGWEDIKASIWSGDLSTGTASFAGGNTCAISSGGQTKAFLTVRSGAAWSGFTAPSTVKTVTRPNGSAIRFEQDGSDWVAPLDGTVSLETSGNNWVFTDASGTVETFDSSGRLISITQRNGQTTTLD